MLLACVLVLAAFPCGAASWEQYDMELFDLVEEFPQNFYQFLSVPQDASPTDIKKAYRRLTLTLHPDKNKDENAETQFRQLVSVYEVLKDEERRQRYDDILVNGLPDWRQPMFYYRRVRKMSNAELGFLLFLILTVGHYAVIWSIYLEKQLDELLSKKKKEKKKKLNSKTIDDSKNQQDRVCDKPHWHDILPLKVSIWLYLSIKSLPQTIQEVKQYYEEYKVMKQRLKEEAEQEEEIFVPREKRPKVKKPKVEFPVYEESGGQVGGAHQSYDQGVSIEEIEEQMNDWLEEKKSAKKKSSEWTEEELSMLSRCMQKFPGGTPGRWEKIAHELGRAVSEVTSKVKQVKDCVNSSGLVKLSELKGKSVMSPRPAGPGCVPDSLMTHREPEPPAAAVAPPAGEEDQPEEQQQEEEEEEVVVVEEEQQVIRRRGVKAKGRRRQGDFDPTALEEEEDEDGVKKEVVKKEAVKEAVEEEVVWTQSQQRLLELALQQNPRGTAQRWDRIAKLVPGKTKEDCMIRYKLLAELVLKRKQAKS